MKIPGLTFIIVPIICWILWINSNIIINSILTYLHYYSIEEIVLHLIVLQLVSILVEIFIRLMIDKLNVDFNDLTVLYPWKLLIKAFIFINNKLTLTI